MLGLFLSIVLINLVLSGDNAVVIALASRSLPPDLQRKAIIWGTAGAVILRIILVALVTLVLDWPYLHALGGILLLYIAYNLLRQNEATQTLHQAQNLGQAIRIILVADLIMSLDNVLAVAALANGHWLLLILGLATSIPIMIFGSSLVLRLMEKFKLLVYLGAGILGWTGGTMIIRDQQIEYWVQSYWPAAGGLLGLLLPAVMAALIVLSGKLRS